MTQILAITWMNLRAIPSRLGSSIVIIVGVAGVVAVLTTLLALAEGFDKTLTSSGRDDRAIVLREGATAELSSGLSQEAVNIIADAPGVTRDDNGRPLVSAEVVVVSDVPKRATDTLANLQVRGVSQMAAVIRDDFRIVEGRMLETGKAEMVVGRSASNQFKNLKVGDTLAARGSEWSVVGVFATKGDMYESEAWVDAPVAQAAFRRGNSYQSVRVQLQDALALDGFAASLADDPRVTVLVERESEFFAKQTGATTRIIRRFGFAVAVVMAIGAVFGALNSMYSAVSTRGQEIATLRALGFGGFPVVVSVLVESLILALLGGLLGGFIAWAFFDGYTVSTLNNASFSQMAFDFAVTPALLVRGLVLALMLGTIGGLMPALRAARLPITTALREL